MARRSALLAKQVISVSSARSLGFVSQLWVDGASVRTGCCSLHLFLFGFGRAACCEPRDSGQFMAAIITYVLQQLLVLFLSASIFGSIITA